MRIFVIGTAASEPTMREAAAKAGHDVLAALPAARAGLVASERERFLLAVDRMMEADLLLVDADAPDAAWCVSWMLARGRLVVVAVAKARREMLSPMIAGNPSPWQRLALHEGDERSLAQALAQALALGP